MNKKYISVISLIALALLACICISCASAENITQDNGTNTINTDHNVVLTAGCEVLSVDNETGKGQVKFNWNINSHGEVMSNTHIHVYKIIQKFGGADYVEICSEEIDPSPGSGSFVEELDLNQGYILRADYIDYAGFLWGTNYSGEMYL